jgi:hypothetical protein
LKEKKKSRMGMEVSKEEQIDIDEFVEYASNGNLNALTSSSSSQYLININGKDSSGDTSLHVSALGGHEDIVSCYC